MNFYERKRRLAYLFAALSVALLYDLRAVPGDGLRHSPYVGLRFAWY